MKRNKKTWILVADGMRARILESERGHAHLKIIECLDRTEERQQRDQPYEERLGRVFDSYGLGRHAIEPRRALGEVEEKRFVQEVLQILSDAFDQNQFDRVVVAAPPGMIGQFRKAMPKNLEYSGIETLNKDLAGMTASQLENYFKEKHGELL